MSAMHSRSWAAAAASWSLGSQTYCYMSPEQFQGRGADARSDIFSFGLVFFEMLTGRPAFEADNPASLIAAILTSKPDVRKLVSLLPPEVEQVLERALAKDPEDRWQTVRDMKAGLEWISSTAAAPAAIPAVAPVGPAPFPGSWQRSLVWRRLFWGTFGGDKRARRISAPR